MPTLIVPVPGQPWPEQGGHYVGQRLVEGVLHHVVSAPGDRPGLASFDLFPEIKAEANSRKMNGHSDWRGPDQEDLMLAYVNAPGLFVRKRSNGIYWSRSEHHGGAWALDFENGRTDYCSRNFEFRVRLFRSFPV